MLIIIAGTVIFGQHFFFQFLDELMLTSFDLRLRRVREQKAGLTERHVSKYFFIA